ncbi:MAG: toll/interleukin-1 receptor domain-containing protein [Pseudonocardiaceae bacterium]
MVSETAGYDVFISYSHALDGALASALQTGLQQFAKPWYRLRALRVFRDTTNLAANPDLWTSIETALASSDWLVLMASPQAAQSKWVKREVEWWLDNKSPQRVLVVVTEGKYVYASDIEEDDNANAAIPHALRDAFPGTPRWVDLRWLHDTNQVDQANPRLRACVADVAAAVRQVDKDTLVGEHITQHRRTMRLARGGVAALTVFLVLALAAAGIAVTQERTAVAERNLALSRQVAGQALTHRTTNPALAAQLALAAYRLAPTAEARGSLLSISSDRDATRLTAHTSDVESVAFNPSGHTLATASTEGTVKLWDLGDPYHPHLLTTLTGHTRAVNSVAFSPDGHTLATGSDDNTGRLWETNPNKAAARICATKWPPITTAQWNQYLSDLPTNPPCQPSN